jgi:dipeptide/tripeptide permease
MKKQDGLLTSFSGQFWLVVFFEFVERGAYYGVMSFLSVYFSDTLGFAKESVGVIKGVIQPLLYFLPILAGAVADRFGYRRILMTAFSLMGLGYIMTSQMDHYAAVFISLVIMGIGAGIFKPIISGTIAKLTDEKNSTMGFGIYYWSINLGAFLVPLILVPWLKGIDPSYVLISAGVATTLMVVPTWFFFKDPVTVSADTRFDINRIINTLAGAFEIIYSPIYLIIAAMKRRTVLRAAILLLLGAALVITAWQSAQTRPVTMDIPRIKPLADIPLIVTLGRNMSAHQPYSLAEKGELWTLTIHKPAEMTRIEARLQEELRKAFPAMPGIDTWLRRTLTELDSPQDHPTLITTRDDQMTQPYAIEVAGRTATLVIPKTSVLSQDNQPLLAALTSALPFTRITPQDLADLAEKMDDRPYFLFFLCAIILLAMLILLHPGKEIALPLVILLLAVTWFFPGQTLLVRIICSVLGLTLLALLRISPTPEKRFSDHWRFLLMILLYSGFWVLYFQMFDSVLWYVRAYVDASSLNRLVNGLLGFLGIHATWFFDVEHVTVISAGTIILLQLVISKLVKDRPALPTMITGIGIATLGMAILSLSTHIGVFVTGLFFFSIGEMTAHPKFISYVGIIAPADSKGLYMGYNFLYGVFGSAIGGVIGARMYVHYVERLNSPSTLWLLFSGIGLLTIISLLLYHRFLGQRQGGR